MTNKYTQDMTGTGMYIDLPNDPEQLELFPELKKKIYESPDKGKTVYERDFGDYSKRELVNDDPEPERYYDWMLWKLRQDRKKP